MNRREITHVTTLVAVTCCLAVAVHGDPPEPVGPKSVTQSRVMPALAATQEWRPVTAQSDSKLIMVSAHVIELKKGVDIDFHVADSQSWEQRRSLDFSPQLIPSKTIKEMISRISKAKKGKVISSPTVITKDDQVATIEVGKEIEIPGSGDVASFTQTVGLKLEVRPKILKADRLALHVRVEHSSLRGKDGETDVKVDLPVIDRRMVEATLSVDSAHTLLLTMPEPNKNLLVFLTPQRVLKLPELTKAVHPSPPVPLAPEASAGGAPSPMSQKVAQLQEIFRELDPNSLNGVFIDEQRLQLTAYVGSDQRDSIPPIIEKIGAIKGLTITEANTRSQRDGVSLEISCSIHTEQAGRSYPAKKIEASNALDEMLRRLFPETKIEVIELNRSVVLRGTADSELMKLVIAVAEDYYSRIINNMELVDGDVVEKNSDGPVSAARPAENPPRTSVETQLDDLRDEVRGLHRDVKRLMKMMETKRLPRRDVSDFDDTRSLSNSRMTTFSAPPHLASTFFELPEWAMTVEEMKNIADQNSKATKGESQTTVLQRRKRRHERIESLYKDLSAFHMTLDRIDRRPEHPDHRQARSTFQASIESYERRLRHELGLEASDGRRIVPHRSGASSKGIPPHKSAFEISKG